MAVNPVKVTIQTYNGVNINDGTVYSSFISGRDLDKLGNPKSDSVMSLIPGGFPTFIRSQPQARIIPLRVSVKTPTLTNIRTIQALFDTLNPSGLVDLVYLDSAGGGPYRVQCACESFDPVMVTGNDWIAMLNVPNAQSEGNSLTSSSTSITASGQTTVINNPGSKVAYPVITITPASKMSHASSQIRRRILSIANRSESPLTDQVGDGYPIDIFDNAFDAAAEVTASQMLSSGNDLRIINYGREINRWLNPATMNANQRGWCNLMYGPMRRVLLPSFSSSSVPAAGTEVAVTSSGGTIGWPDSGFGIYDNEVVQFTRTPTGFVIVARGARGSTAAAHSAGYFYLDEQPFLTAIYDYTAAADPLPPDDRQMMQDGGTSRNNKRVWTSNFVNVGDRRSGAWQTRYTDDDDAAPNISVYKFATGPTLRFQDTLPAASTPRANNFIIDLPVPSDVSAGAFTMDHTISSNFRLDGYVTDLDGNETLLINKLPAATTDVLSAQPYTPASPIQRLRLNARIGAIIGSLTSGLTEINASFLLPNYATNPYSYGFMFTLDQESYVNGFFIAIKKTGSVDNVVWTLTGDDGGQPDEARVLATGTIANASIGSSYGYLYIPLDSIAVQQFPAGGYWLTFAVLTPSGGTIEVGRSGGRTTFGIIDIVNDILIYNETTPFRLLSNKTPAQANAYLNSGDFLTVDNINIDLDDVTPRTPKIIIGAEQDCYMLNCRVKNDTTGEYFDLFYPMKFGEHVTIDCENKTVVDSETGLDIPFIISPSSNAWLSFRPGNNTISYTEVGVVATTLAWAYRVQQSTVI